MKFQIMQEQDRNAGITWGTGTEWSILGLVQVHPLFSETEGFSHIMNRKTYIEAIHEKQPIETEEELLSEESQMEEFMYLGLRKGEWNFKRKI